MSPEYEARMLNITRKRSVWAWSLILTLSMLNIVLINDILFAHYRLCIFLPPVY
jgi:hypothetical protein